MTAGIDSPAAAEVVVPHSHHARWAVLHRIYGLPSHVMACCDCRGTPPSRSPPALCPSCRAHRPGAGGGRGAAAAVGASVPRRGPRCRQGVRPRLATSSSVFRKVTQLYVCLKSSRTKPEVVNPPPPNCHTQGFATSSLKPKCISSGEVPPATFFQAQSSFQPSPPPTWTMIYFPATWQERWAVTYFFAFCSNFF